MTWQTELFELLGQATRQSIWGDLECPGAPPIKSNAIFQWISIDAWKRWALYGLIFYGDINNWAEQQRWPDWLSVHRGSAATGESPKTINAGLEPTELLAFLIVDQQSQIDHFHAHRQQIVAAECIVIIVPAPGFTPNFSSSEGLSYAHVIRLADENPTHPWGAGDQKDFLQRTIPALALIAPLVLPGWIAADFDQYRRFIDRGTCCREITVRALHTLPSSPERLQDIHMHMQNELALEYDRCLLVLGRTWFDDGGSEMLGMLDPPQGYSLGTIVEMREAVALLFLSRPRQPGLQLP
jgi:hypothetical protein